MRAAEKRTFNAFLCRKKQKHNHNTEKEAELIFMFNNTITYTRGRNIPCTEEYTDFKTYEAKRHVFKDMIHHDSEVSAVRLAEAGVFEKSEFFQPKVSITVREFVRGIFHLAGKADNGTSDAEIEQMALTDLLKDSIGNINFNAVLTNEWMAYLLDAACEDVENIEQYRLMIADYDQIDDDKKKSVLKVIALGLVEAEKKFKPRKFVTRAQAADCLYRLANPGMRLIPPYDMGDAYQEGKSTYLVKNTYAHNPGGIQLGTWAGYNRQEFAFQVMGKRPIDRVDFHKWCHQELTKGEYSFPKFENEKVASRYGNTIITSVEIAANRTWNPRFHSDMIPQFYKQDITDPETRQAAKNYMYAFVYAMMTELKSDVMLSLDYEVDWEMDLDKEITEASKWRAAEWGKWYVEACEVARQAARDAGAEDRLKMIVIYNNVNDLTKLGPKENQWMLDCAAASDVIGIDVYYYDLVKDLTDPTKFMQDMRYLINNYSLGKPVMVVENGIPIDGKTATDFHQEGYFRNLFRAFRFELSEGGYLNRNLDGYLFWDMIRGEGGGVTTGVFHPDRTPCPSGAAIIEGIRRLECLRQHNPSILISSEVVSDAGAAITVKSGTEFEKLTYLTSVKAGAKTLKVSLNTDATVFVTVNDMYHYLGQRDCREHTIDLPEGIEEGFNKIEIFFGNITKPLDLVVQSVSLN